MKTFEIKYRGHWGSNIGYSTIKAKSEQDAKRQVSRWGFVMECDEMPHCKNCNRAHDGKYVFLRSSHCCSILCEQQFTRKRLEAEI